MHYLSRGKKLAQKCGLFPQFSKTTELNKHPLDEKIAKSGHPA
jgi:hypothetical protein